VQRIKQQPVGWFLFIRQQQQHGFVLLPLFMYGF
jgi:hypothetical protein